MKNLNKRTKMILAVVSVVVVAAVAVAIFAQISGSRLFGATGENVVITPSRADLIVNGDTVQVSINTTYKCDWSLDNKALVFEGPSTDTKTVTIKGVGPGGGFLYAYCGLFRNSRHSILVSSIPAITPVESHIAVGETLTLTTGYPVCIWYSLYDKWDRPTRFEPDLPNIDGASVTVRAVENGYDYIEARCALSWDADLEHQWFESDKWHQLNAVKINVP